MIKVEAHPQQATAYQYLAETADVLSKLVLPTGPVTVQMADEMNRIPSRCYVPTAWGTAILEEGDWIVVYDVGIVSTFSAAQYPLLFDMVYEDPGVPVEPTVPELPDEVLVNEGPHVETYGKVFLGEDLGTRMQSAPMPAVRVSPPAPERQAVLRFRVTKDSGSWLPSFEMYCTRYRLDYMIDVTVELDTLQDEYQVIGVATGREILSFKINDLVDCYVDGELEVVAEA